MLDSETKKKIDEAKAMLVGKVPVPKDQVEQITIALIYKFMDDMDAESEELGGKRKFFTGEFARYGWAKLMRSGLGGHDILNLYVEGLDKIPENPGIPALFRDIFKNAFLPFKDPQTLKGFLKIIDWFKYDHSERLGDAFEYLLSVNGSQSDAGQFRTPRHIIDFMVKVVDPKKDEIVLDPACGTAGFLVSSYKHILEANKDTKGHSKLTPDEKGRLAENFKGYDISPDMVRLSLVNLYLHGFTSPKINEYDTLTSEDKWNELADVILANPPFMSPKGGIKPHKRFSVQSKRSEVLFVDYMAEHLTPKGRAGIIVPEGIIFQSGKAYKQLRKMLVEDYLVAVVSLPAGVFQPYSGVKTSILIFDKVLAKQSETIGFFKVENDGYDLGAQRREIDKDDLPTALEEITEYLELLQLGKSLNDFKPSLGLITPKEKIAENGEYNLSGERYREAIILNNIFPQVAIGDVCELYQPKTISKKDLTDKGPYLVYGANGVIGRYNQYNHENSEVLVTCRGATCGTINLSKPQSWITGNAMVATPKNTNLSKNFLYHLLKALDLSAAISGAAQPQITRQNLSPVQIPLPPIEIQKEIVAEIEGYQKVIDGARAVVDNYKPHIAIDPEWPMQSIGQLCTVERGASPRPIKKFVTNSSEGINWVKIGDAKIGSKYITETNEKISKEGAKKSRAVKKGNFILSNSMSFGRPYIMAVDGCIHDGWLLLSRFSDKLNTDFLYYVLGSDFIYKHFEKLATGGVVNNLNSELVRNVKIPLPPINYQRQIASNFEAEQALVDANHELIDRFEKKIQDTIARVWGEDPSTKEERIYNQSDFMKAVKVETISH